MRPLSRPSGAYLALLAPVLTVLVASTASSPELRLKVRTRVEIYKGSGDWREVAIDEPFSPSSSALILCDMWDNHWCRGAAGRVEILARKVSPVIDLARARGVLIIHAPSETMPYYRDMPQRLSMLSIPTAQPPAALALTILHCPSMIPMGVVIPRTIRSLSIIGTGLEKTPGSRSPRLT